MLAAALAGWIAAFHASVSQSPGQAPGDSGAPQSSADSTPPTSLAPFTLSDDQARDSVQWLASVAIDKLPRTIRGDRGWGATKRLWSGVDVKRDGWQLKTHRRYRDVEHGRWVQYEVMLPESSARNAPQVAIHRVAAVIDPVDGSHRWRIDAAIESPMTFTARVQLWNLGVRNYSVTVRGEMQLRLSTSATMAFQADYGEIPPALVIDPRVDQAHLSLQRFEVHRISHVGGDVAEQWGELLQEILVERLVRKQNDGLTDRLNRGIDKERPDLRFSLMQWLQKNQEP